MEKWFESEPLSRSLARMEVQHAYEEVQCFSKWLGGCVSEALKAIDFRMQSIRSQEFFMIQHKDNLLGKLTSKVCMVANGPFGILTYL